MTAATIKINDRVRPIGFQLDEAFKVSWDFSSQPIRGVKQTAAQVVIALDEAMTQVLFDSQKDETVTGYFRYVHLDTEPRTRYYVQVRIWTDAGEELLSEVSYFETGKHREAWSGRWIAAPREADFQPRFRKVFRTEKPIRQARLYICGLGLYEAYLNQQKIGHEYLTPGFHAYDFWLQYQTYEAEVQEGENTLDLYLGDGWYKGRIGFDGGYRDLYGTRCQVIADLIVTYEDGSEEVIATDESWQTAASPVTASSIYDGEVFEPMRAEEPDWQAAEAGEDLTERLTERLSLPVAVHERLKPTVLRTPAGETVLDFGQNMTGWIQFESCLPRGAEVSYEVGEILQNGNFYKDNLRTAQAAFTYISDGSPRTVRPHFTFYGFRYAKLTGFPDDLTDFDFEGLVLHSELEQTGRIETSNPAVNQLLSNILWGQKGNFLDVPTDCPQRDERLGWTGDAQIFARTAGYNMFTPAFYEKFLRDLRLEQEALDGSVPFMVPMLKPEGDAGFVTGNGAAAWSDAATVIPWVLYEQYGDKVRLAAHYPIMKDWVDYVRREDDRSGGHRLWTTNFQFGDWLALDGKDPNSPLGGTDTVLVASVYYYYSSCLLAKAARVLGYETDSAVYSQLAVDIKKAIQDEYFTPQGRLAVQTQTAYTLLLFFDLVPQAALDRTVEGLKQLLLESSLHLKTGFVGTPYLCETLSRYGLNDYAYTLLLNDDFPSWLYAVKMGATTVWERWNSVLPDGSMNPQGMNSLNHYAYGSIEEWLYRIAAGIQADPDQPAFQHFYLRPQPSQQLPEIRASYHSAYGEIVSRSRILEDGRLAFDFTLPFNSSATIILPDAPLEGLQSSPLYEKMRQVGRDMILQAGAGSYHFVYEPSRPYRRIYRVTDTYEALISSAESRKIIEKHLPALVGNELALAYSDRPLADFVHLPIVSNFVTDETLQAAAADFRGLAL